MAIKKRTSRMSNGGRTKANKAQTAKKLAKFAAKREAGNAYEYKPNPYKKGTRNWYIEKEARAAKMVSHKLPYAKDTSIFRKLQNALDAVKLAEKSTKKVAPQS